MINILKGASPVTYLETEILIFFSSFLCSAKQGEPRRSSSVPARGNWEDDCKGLYLSLHKALLSQKVQKVEELLCLLYH
jgi:hypothetical protein